MFIVAAAFGVLLCVTNVKQIKYNILSLIVGGIFGFGLMVSGMLRVSKVIGFLSLNSNWDPSLGFAMLGAIGFNFFAF